MHRKYNDQTNCVCRAIVTVDKRVSVAEYAEDRAMHGRGWLSSAMGTLYISLFSFFQGAHLWTASLIGHFSYNSSIVHFKFRSIHERVWLRSIRISYALVAARHHPETKDNKMRRQRMISTNIKVKLGCNFSYLVYLAQSDLKVPNWRQVYYLTGKIKGIDMVRH